MLFRSATPASGVVDQYDPDGRTLVVRFNRAFDPRELRTLRMVPAPTSAGRLSFDTPRQVVWYDVVFDPTVSTYDWLLDGRTVHEPVLITLYTSTADRDLGTISGRLRHGPGRNADDAIVYVLERSPAAEPIPEDVLTFLGRRPLRASLLDPRRG